MVILTRVNLVLSQGGVAVDVIIHDLGHLPEGHDSHGDSGEIHKDDIDELVGTLSLELKVTVMPLVDMVQVDIS